MDPTEQKIFDDIVERHSDRISSNNNWSKLAKSDFDISALERAGLIQKEIKLTSYLDGRRNLVNIPNFCSETGEKVDVKKIKKALLKYEKSDTNLL